MPLLIISADLSVRTLALPMPMVDAAHSITSCDSDHPEDVGIRVMNPAKLITGWSIVRPALKTLPSWPPLNSVLSVTIRNQTRATVHSTPFSSANSEPISVG
ncbi:hypothetical protein D3C71_1462220 [compost metagenome]